MIDIQNITTLTNEEILNLLFEEGQPLEVCLPKTSQQFFSSNQDIAVDAAEAAYSGQLLSNISESFQYEYVPPAECKSVKFTLYCSNVLKLTEVLYEISFACGREYEEPESETFYMLATYFLEDVQQGKIKPVCPDFVEDFFEFIDENNEESD